MDLNALKSHVDQARVEYAEPPPPGETRPLIPVSELLTEEGWAEVWTVVRQLRREHGAVFNLFPEITAALNVIDIVGDSDGVPTLADIADGLEQLADQEGPWVVSVPLTNLEMKIEEPVVKIDDETVLWRAYLGDEVHARLDPKAREIDEDSAFEVFHLLGEHVQRASRFLTYGGTGEEIDTRRAATIFSVEAGTAGVAVPQAAAKAAYAIAVWVILAPPERGRAMPDLAIWSPQPYIRQSPQYKAREPGAWPARERTQGGAFFDHRGYEIADETILRMPFQAFAARERRSAQALLSASLALQSASRGSRYQLSERLRNVLAAIETLCESAPGAHDASSRWAKLVGRYNVEDELAKRGHEEGDSEKVGRRLRQARNVAAHGADAALIDLGWPPGVDRQMARKAAIRSEDLAISALHADLSALMHGVSLVLSEMWPTVAASDFDDAQFESLFR